MNNYITLNGKRYKTPKGWEPSLNKPSTDRVTLGGDLDVTYGPAATREWNGEIEVPYSATDPWGQLSDLETALVTLASLSFTDHLGANYTVHVLGKFTYRSLLTLWDASSNKFFVPVRLVEE